MSPILHIDIRINWVQYSNPTPGCDLAHGVCLLENKYLVVTGIADHYAHIELRDKYTGNLLREWTNKKKSRFYNCLTIDNKIYAVGREETHWVIYIFDKDLNIIRKVTSVEGEAHSIATDGKYLYIAGYRWGASSSIGRTSGGGRIEKRDIDYLDLVEEWEGDFVTDIAINPVTRRIWAIGSSIIIFGEGLGYPLRKVRLPRFHLLNICFDDEGNAYVVSRRTVDVDSVNGIAKLDPSGKVVEISERVGGNKILCIDDYIYVFADEEVDPFLGWRHAMYILDRDLNMVKKVILSKNISASSHFHIGKAAFDGKNIYVAGQNSESSPLDTRWIIYSISVNCVNIIDELWRIERELQELRKLLEQLMQRMENE